MRRYDKIEESNHDRQVMRQIGWLSKRVPQALFLPPINMDNSINDVLIGFLEMINNEGSQYIFLVFDASQNQAR